VALPVLWTEASRRRLWVGRRGGGGWLKIQLRLAGCDGFKGKIAEGVDADFIVLDPEEDFVVSEDRCTIGIWLSPYLGERLRG